MSTYFDNQTLFITCGATNGVMIQLAAAGTMTALLTAAPTLSFWRFRYLQYTNFSMVSVNQGFCSGGVQFNSQSTVKVIKSGDLLYFTYVVIKLPGIRACPLAPGGCTPSSIYPYSADSNNPCSETDAAFFAAYKGGVPAWMFNNYGSCGGYEEDCAANPCGVPGDLCDTDPWASWTNAVGQFLVKKVVLQVGQQTVDTLYNDYLFIWEELSGKPGKRLTEMVGKFYCREDLIAFSNQTRNLYVPLPFFYTKTSGNAFPLVSLSGAHLHLTVYWANFTEAIVVSGPDVSVVKCSGGGPLVANDLEAGLDTWQIFLDTLERDRFAAVQFEQLTDLVQTLYTPLGMVTSSRVQLSFAYTSIELNWAIRRQCNALHNNWFNYTGINGRDPISNATIFFNTTERQPTRNANYFRLVQPYQFHTNIPDACIYCYSFALYPEESQPSGGACFSRLDSIYLTLTFQEGLEKEDITVIIFSRAYQFLRYRDGAATAVFAS